MLFADAQADLHLCGSVGSQVAAKPADAAVYFFPKLVRVPYNSLIIVDLPVPACPITKKLCPEKTAEILFGLRLIFNHILTNFYAPSFEEVDWAYWFGFLSVLVCFHLSVGQEPCMLGFEISYMDSSWKNSSHTLFFLCPSYLPFWSYAPLNKSE